MAEIVNMPKLGFDMAEGTLVRWVVPEGEAIAKGAVLAEIETDKATVEVESNFEGVVARHLVDEGTPVPVGDPIAVIGAEGEKIDFEALLGEQAAEEPAKKEAKEPQKQKEKAPAREEAAAPEVAAAPEGTHLPEGVRASPLARRMADDEGINLSQVKGTGPQGRIVKKDVETYLQQKPAAAPAEVAPKEEKGPAIPMPVFTPAGPPPPDESMPLSRLRAAVGRRMTQSKQQVPHFYVTHEYDMAPVMALRKQINSMLGDGEKISVNDFIVKAVALALRQFPNLNAALEGDEIVHRGQVNIGVAVSVEGGLLTVVCRDADRKSLRQISMEVRALASRARVGKVRPNDIELSQSAIWGCLM